MPIISTPFDSVADVTTVWQKQDGVVVAYRGEWYLGTVTNFSGNLIEVTITNPPTLDEVGITHRLFPGTKRLKSKWKVDGKTLRTTKPGIKKVVEII